MRSDFAEQLACALTPLLVLTTLQLCGVVENRRRLWPRSMGFFAVVFAAVWLSNAPAAVVEANRVKGASQTQNDIAPAFSSRRTIVELAEPCAITRLVWE